MNCTRRNSRLQRKFIYSRKEKLCILGRGNALTLSSVIVLGRTAIIPRCIKLQDLPAVSALDAILLCILSLQPMHGLESPLCNQPLDVLLFFLDCNAVVMRLRNIWDALQHICRARGLRKRHLLFAIPHVASG